MELNSGYKQMAGGVIPKDWIVTTVRDLIADGLIEKPLDGNHGSIHPKSSDFVDFGIPFVMANNIKDGHVDLVNCSFIRKAQADLLQKGFSKTGDVLITHKATIGNTAIVGKIEFPYIMLTPQVTYYRVIDRERLSNVYLRYYFDSASFQSVLRDLADGGTRAYIGISAQHQLPIILPSNLPEQHAIAAALIDVDALLNGLDRLIAKKRNLKQAAMQQLLTGETRLPGFGREWEVKPLGDIAEIVMGQSPSSSNYNSRGEGLPLIQGNADIEDRKTIKRIFTTQVTKRGCAGDILMSVRAPVGEISRAIFNVCLGRGVCALRFPNDFLYHYLVFLEPTWSKHSKGSTFDSVNSADVKAVEIKMPIESNEQHAIAAVLSDIDAEIAALEQRRSKTRDIKQAMMNELLTGKTRLVTSGVCNA